MYRRTLALALEHPEHQRRALGVGDGELALGLAEVAPGQHADQAPLARLRAGHCGSSRTQLDAVVLVEHLVDRLGQEG